MIILVTDPFLADHLAREGHLNGAWSLKYLLGHQPKLCDSPQTISTVPTERLYHLLGTLTPASLAPGNTLANLAYSERRSLCRSLEMLGVILRVPRNVKKMPSRMLRLRMTRAAMMRPGHSVISADNILKVDSVLVTHNKLTGELKGIQITFMMPLLFA